MKTYKTVYSFDVLEKIKGGYKVWMNDRQEKEVSLVNTMDVEDFIAVLNDDAKSGRYDFWIVIEVETEKQNNE